MSRMCSYLHGVTNKILKFCRKTFNSFVVADRWFGGRITTPPIQGGTFIFKKSGRVDRQYCGQLEIRGPAGGSLVGAGNGMINRCWWAVGNWV